MRNIAEKSTKASIKAGNKIESGLSGLTSSQGHGIIINMNSYAPFVFTFNPESVETQKNINYSIAPNIGGASKKRYFAGFDAKEVTFNIVCLDMEAPTGVMSEIAFFEQLREPDGGPLMGLSLYGNLNFPPPKVLFQFGVSMIPLIWTVLNVKISESHFHYGSVRGVIGVPKRAEISISLALDEDSNLNKANQIVKKVEMYAASAKSIVREVLYKKRGTRKELPGIFSKQKGKGKNIGQNSRY